MDFGYLCFLGCWFFLALSVTPSSQALAVQSTSVVLLDHNARWQHTSVDPSWSSGDSDKNRLPWVLGGAVLGGGFGYVLLVATHLYSTDPPQLEYILGGAAFGAIAGLLISGPSAEEENELRLGYAVRAYVPAQGGIGLALDF